MERQKTQHSQHNIESEEPSLKTKAPPPPQLQGLLYSYSHQESVVCAEEQTDQWNRVQNPEINPHKYTELLFDKGAMTIQWSKDSFFNKFFGNN